VRRATRRENLPPRETPISIHALREEGDTAMRIRWSHLPSISIHALREEGDNVPLIQEPLPSKISIHALREEGDASIICTALSVQDFNPRPP